MLSKFPTKHVDFSQLDSVIHSSVDLQTSDGTPVGPLCTFFTQKDGKCICVSNVLVQTFHSIRDNDPVFAAQLSRMRPTVICFPNHQD